MSEEGVGIKPSQVVIALAELASSGSYDNMTRGRAQAMEELFKVTADLINVLEAAEKKADDEAAAANQLLEEMAAQATDDEEEEGETLE